VINHINPDKLLKNSAFSQIVTTQGKGKTIYIAGQTAVNANREIIGKGDIKLQTEQVMKNLKIALAECNATFDNLVKLTIYIVQGQNALDSFAISQQFMSQCENPPIITVVYVAGLIIPDFLLEIDAVAFVEV
jgi:enamine deaminase RidA (YjgF/YER057c/UK114 family)